MGMIEERKSMIRTWARSVTVALALVVLGAIPAMANQLNITVTTTCGCQYTITATGGGVTPNVPVTIDYSFKASVDNMVIDAAGSGTLHVNSDANGNFSLTVAGIPINIPCAGKVIDFHFVLASLNFDGVSDGFGFNPPSPAHMDCTNPPPPPVLPCPAGSFTFSYDAAGNLVIIFDQFPAPNDNSYGANAVGWGDHGHTFGNLTGSDHAGFQLKDPNGVVKLSFNIDYLSANVNALSGYSSLGPFGGDGKVLIGALTTADIAWTTSLAERTMATFGCSTRLMFSSSAA
jgi:hypothetical protein